MFEGFPLFDSIKVIHLQGSFPGAASSVVGRANTSLKLAERVENTKRAVLVPSEALFLRLRASPRASRAPNHANG